MRPDDWLAYEIDDRPPAAVSLGVASQGVVLCLAPIALCAVFVAGTGHVPDGYLAWAIFAALIANGIATAVQASRFGARAMVLTGTAPQYLPVSATALAAGGPALLAGLAVAAALFQFALAAWLPRLRRVVTPAVSGTVFVLIAVAMLPVAFGSMADSPEGAPGFAAPAAAAATLAVAVAMGLRATGRWRLWSPVIGILAGCAAAAALGAYDFSTVSGAAWVGVPAPTLPGLDPTLGRAFWSLLPAFLIVSLALAIKCAGTGIVMQRVSSNAPRVTDYRLVQGAVRGNALGSLLSGAAGVPPTITYDGVNVALAGLTGVAARRTGYFAGAIMAGLAFLPKLTALLLSIPPSVLGASLLVLAGTLIVEGVKTAVQDGLGFRQTLVVGVALALGVGLEIRPVAELPGGPWTALLDGGITAGALAAIAMTAFMELTGPRRRRLRVDLSETALPRVDAFLRDLAAGRGWSGGSGDRLRAVGEEALQSLLRGGRGDGRRLTLVARTGRGEVELEFLAALSELNVEDEISWLGDTAERPDPDETSLRLLRHYASSVRHRKYHGVDVITARVEGLR